MKKELKDSLHLYLGCECVTPDGVMILNGLNINDSRNKVWFYCRWDDKKNCYLPKQNADILGKQSLVGKSYALTNIKPILRPLSDMTEEEANKYYAIKGANAFNPFEGASVAFLLSKHFDLFGLTEAGLAIDATTLKQKS